MRPPFQIRIYTDGSCPFCLWARGVVEPYDRDRRLEFRDFNVPEIASETPFPTSELARRIHVLKPDGTWLAGYWGWITILEAIPRYRWLARLMRWIPFRWVGPYFYNFFARNRYRIPAIFLGLVGVPRPCDDQCSIPSDSTKIENS